MILTPLSDFIELGKYEVCFNWKNFHICLRVINRTFYSVVKFYVYVCEYSKKCSLSSQGPASK